METSRLSAVLDSELAQLPCFNTTEAAEFRREVLTLDAHPALSPLLTPALLRDLLLTYRHLENQDTELARQLHLLLPATQRPARLVDYFESLLGGDAVLPELPAARAALVALAARGIDTELLRTLLRTERWAMLPPLALQRIGTAHPYSLSVWIALLQSPVAEELTADQHEVAVFLLLEALYCTDLDENSATHCGYFLRAIFPAFAECFADRCGPGELFRAPQGLSTWYQVWRRHQDRSELRLLDDDPYYTTDFRVVIRNVPRYLWWNNGIAYGQAGRQYTFGSPGFAYLAAGGSIRRNPSDYRPYTRRMAREFVSLCPYTAATASDRYLELYFRSLGAGPLLCEMGQHYVSHSDTTQGLRVTFDRWNPVIQKLADPVFESLDREAARALLGYCYHQLRDRSDFRVNRRSLALIQRDAEEYYARIEARRQRAEQRAAERAEARRQTSQPGLLRWAASNRIRPLEHDYGRYASIRQRKIVELLNENQLAQEGVLMRNCVATYSMDCYRAGTMIWSLRELNRDGSWKSRVTIEVRYPTIVQARGRYNAVPSDAEMELIREWARDNQLVFNPGAY